MKYDVSNLVMTALPFFINLEAIFYVSTCDTRTTLLKRLRPDRDGGRLPHLEFSRHRHSLFHDFQSASLAALSVAAILFAGLSFPPMDMYRFVHHSGDSKRVRPQRTCALCRRKKKRCTHQQVPNGKRLENRSDAEPAPGPSRLTILHAPPVNAIRYDKPSDNQPSPCTSQTVQWSGPHTASNPRRDSNVVYNYADRHDHDTIDQSPHSMNTGQMEEARDRPSNLGLRFIGHLNPEGMFHTDHQPITSPATASQSNVGIWLKERHGGAETANTRFKLFDHFDCETRRLVIPLIEASCSLVTSAADFHSLSAIYLDKIHPIFPVLHSSIFETYHHDPNSVLLRQGICLVASMNREAKSFLRLQDSTDHLSHRAFAKRIFSAMRAAVDLESVTDKVVLIQALSLMSLYIEGPEGRALSSQLCARAIDHAHLIGLHVQARANVEDEGYADTLLCSVWAIDKLHAAFHGRPVLMHERDLRIDFDACIQKQQKPFRLMLQIIGLLHKVIDLYRPRSDSPSTQWDGTFPTFEDIVQDSCSFQIMTPLLGKRAILVGSHSVRYSLL